MSYIKYLYQWFKRYGFTFKNQPVYNGIIVRKNIYRNLPHYEFLNPIAFYKEKWNCDLWMQAAKDRKLMTDKQFGEIYGDTHYTRMKAKRLVKLSKIERN